MVTLRPDIVWKIRGSPVAVVDAKFGAGSHPGMDGAFVVLDFPDPADQSIAYTESASGGLFLEEDVELRRYMLMFEHLRAAALRPEATLMLLAEIAAET